MVLGLLAGSGMGGVSGAFPQNGAGNDTDLHVVAVQVRSEILACQDLPAK